MLVRPSLPLIHRFSCGNRLLSLVLTFLSFMFLIGPFLLLPSYFCVIIFHLFVLFSLPYFISHFSWVLSLSSSVAFIWVCFFSYSTLLSSFEMLFLLLFWFSLIRLFQSHIMSQAVNKTVSLWCRELQEGRVINRKWSELCVCLQGVSTFRACVKTTRAVATVCSYLCSSKSPRRPQHRASLHHKNNAQYCRPAGQFQLPFGHKRVPVTGCALEMWEVRLKAYYL
jgi:hypothetical protein